METQHTKGEWHVLEQNSPYNHKIICTGFHEEALIAELPFGNRENDKDSIISNDTVRANARLIAAAPNMLEAIVEAEDALMSIEVDRYPHHVYVQIQKATMLIEAAYKKATGQS